MTLRSKTSKAHESVDEALINFDLTSPAGLRDYLCIHFLARRQLADIQSGHKLEIDHSQTLADIQSDLEVLGADIPQNMGLTMSTALHPIGLTYVIAGSSLGSKLLYKQWACAIDARVQRAGKFMTRAKDNSDWIKFLNYIGATDFSLEETDDIVASANACFDIFQASIKKIAGASK